MPESICQLASRLLHDPLRGDVAPVTATADRIEQRVCHVQRHDKHRLLVHTLKKYPDGLVLVFSRTKHGANRLADNLGRDGIEAAAIHGNKSQGARQRALEDFRTGRTRVLVATDIAARGIDVKGIALVINFDIPDEPEAYVHRIGRTARMGASGLAFSFCDPSEHSSLRDIQRLIHQTIPVQSDHPFAAGAQAGATSPAVERQPGAGASANFRRRRVPAGGNGVPSVGQGQDATAACVTGNREMLLPAPGGPSRRFGFAPLQVNRGPGQRYAGFLAGRMSGRRG
jgi:ATP-dependent RNA helicase RhlE